MRQSVILRVAAVSFVVLVAACATSSAVPNTSARAPSDERLATDRRFAAASARGAPAAETALMFAEDAVMPSSDGHFADGRARIADALSAPPVGAEARIEWTPIRVGVSADGQQGFTLGYMNVTPQDGASLPFKYLAYWVKSDGTWRIVAYRRGAASAPTADPALMAASLPARALPVATDAARIAGYRASLDSAERAFSRDAQTIGLGAAFRQLRLHCGFHRRRLLRQRSARRESRVVGARSRHRSVER